MPVSNEQTLTKPCPVCGESLSLSANDCPKCFWVASSMPRDLGSVGRDMICMVHKAVMDHQGEKPFRVRDLFGMEEKAPAFENAMDSHFQEEANQRHNLTASFLNVIPGLGHLYKGHVLTGLMYMFLGMPLSVIAGGLFVLPTAGLSLLLPFAVWTIGMIEVYYIEDLPWPWLDHFLEKWSWIK
jgi:hypothetical protein